MDHPFAQHSQGDDGALVDTMLPPEDSSAQAHSEPPPPPYESVVMSHEDSRGPELRSSQAAQRSAQPKFDITVTDPLKQGEGVGAYTSYKVCTTTDAEQYRTRQPEVIRRYRDFCWLHDRLTEQHRGVIVPPIPEKNVVQKYQMTQEFVSVRKLALQVFINRVAAHPVLWSSSSLQLFLEASEGDFLLEVARGTHEAGGGAKKKLASTLQLFRDLGQSTANLVASGRHQDEEEDPDYLKVRDYTHALEGHLAEVHKQAQRLLKRQAELGLALQDFGASMACLSAFDSAPLDQAFHSLADRASAASSLAQRQSEELTNTFEAPLKEAVRAVKACQAVMADRAQALQAVQSARSDQEARRTKLNKLRGIPGIKVDKVAEAEHEVYDAGTRLETAQDAYETIVRRMSQELARFQRERAQETMQLLQDFTRSQAALAGEQSKLWCSLLDKAPQSANGHR